LRDVFVFAYERSSAQYRVVRESLGNPDPVRLRYRTQLADVTQLTVKAGEPPSISRLRQRGQALGVPEEDLDVFIETAFEIILGLHEGSAAKCGLTPRELRDWREQFQPAS
jgi:hypothetical protein